MFFFYFCPPSNLIAVICFVWLHIPPHQTVYTFLYREQAGNHHMRLHCIYSDFFSFEQLRIAQIIDKMQKPHFVSLMAPRKIRTKCGRIVCFARRIKIRRHKSGSVEAQANKIWSYKATGSSKFFLDTGGYSLRSPGFVCARLLPKAANYILERIVAFWERRQGQERDISGSDHFSISKLNITSIFIITRTCGIRSV